VVSDIHLGHSGVDSCLRLARESVYWPGMTTDIRNKVQKCAVCREFQPSQGKETLMSHDLPERPWQKIATDILTYDNKTYMVSVLLLIFLGT